MIALPIFEMIVTYFLRGSFLPLMGRSIHRLYAKVVSPLKWLVILEITTFRFTSVLHFRPLAWPRSIESRAPMPRAREAPSGPYALDNRGLEPSWTSGNGNTCKQHTRTYEIEEFLAKSDHHHPNPNCLVQMIGAARMSKKKKRFTAFPTLMA